MTTLDGGPPPLPKAAPPQDILALLGDHSTLTARRSAPPAFHVEEAADPAALGAYRRLRHDVFVTEQGLFDRHDRDEHDDDPRTLSLVARDPSGAVLGGVRLGPAHGGADIGWWAGGRLAVHPGARHRGGIGAALVRAACARAEAAGALRFDATVQAANETLFTRLGWRSVRPVTVAGRPHVLMRHPVGRVQALVTAAKGPLGDLLSALADGPPGTLGGPGYVGDDGAPVPGGGGLVAACDAILPALAERDPDWAGWCSVLVNLNDLAAMGARPAGLLDAVAAPDLPHARRLLGGLARAAAAYGVPVLGGHTQLGVPAALSVTALGRAARPVPGGGGRPGHRVRLTADLGGGWRPGYHGRQWDSTTRRTTAELTAMLGAVAAAAPAAAKDVSMAGVVGTLGMLAEAGGCRAVLDVANVPRPPAATAGDWLTCFPGYAMLTTETPERSRALPAGPATSAECGELTSGEGVGLRWPDGEITEAVTAAVTGMGTA
ncbi:MSMEG_0567/sll0787 family protein [Streptomyces tremellae]|uniref:GNAT family N-acetyltransferase n=1 Tax=Streptomyces tremellae TaxID=1124239 RepID=A0ABP7FV96_9ACTN